MNSQVRSVHRFGCHLLYCCGGPSFSINTSLPALHQSRLSSFRTKMASVRTAAEPSTSLSSSSSSFSTSFTPTAVISKSLPSIKSTSTTRVIACATSSTQNSFASSSSFDANSCLSPLSFNLFQPTSLCNETRKALQCLAGEDEQKCSHRTSGTQPNSDQPSNSKIDGQLTNESSSSTASSSIDSIETESTPPNLRNIYRNNLYNRSRAQSESEMRAPPFQPRKALLLTKFSRLEYERRRMPDCSDTQIKESLIRRGSDYDGLLAHHNIHTRSREHVRQTLEDGGIEVRVVNRFQYNEEQIDWADVIITAGGDGTFLMAASKIFTKSKPVIGINSDPSRSVGYLCLDPAFSLNFRPALERLQSGNFRWIYRQRIRVSIKGESSLDPPAELHNQQLLHPEFRYLDLETHPLNRRSNSPPRPDTTATNNAGTDYQSYHVLPVRALNDVFIGECLSSRVSYFEFAVDDRPAVKVKSSGVTICTGTGSTSWSFNINKISPQSVQTLFSLIKEETGVCLNHNDQQLVRKLTKKFNDSLIFDVCEKTMAYTVRDPVYMGNEFDSENRGFTNRITIKSRMFDACIVIDGGLSYAFNDGAYARFDLLDEDQLQTIAFD